ELTIAGRPIAEPGEGALLEVAWDGERLDVDGGVPGLFRLEGGGLLTQERADLEIELASNHLGRLAEVAAPQVPEGLTGNLQGVLAVSGSFQGPDGLLVRLRLPELVLDYQGHTVSNVEPVVVRLGDEALQVESLFLEELDTGSELFAQGSLGLAEPRALDFRLQGSFATEWVELFAPGVEMEGRFNALATVAGTLEEPRLNGQGALQDARLVAEGFPQSLEGLDALVLFYPEQVVLDNLNARVAGGTLQASGRVGLYGPQGSDYRLQAQVEDVTLRYPEGFWIRTDAALALASTPDGRVVQGTVDLERAFYLKEVEASLFQLLRQTLRAERMEVAETGEIERTTQLAVNVQAPAGAVQVRNNLADLQGSANLTVRGTLARPILFGQVEFEREGTLVYSDNEFEVERARISFANPARIDPVIDLVATTEIRQYDVTLNLSGRLENLQAQVSSDPPLSDLDVVALLTTGQVPGGRSLVPGEQEAAAQAAQQFLAGQAASAVAERVGTLFGFDRFRISPVGSEAGGALAGVGVTVGKRLSKDVFVTYTEQPTAPEGSLLQVEWQVDANLTLVLTATGDENYRVDARWDRRF
ncbi:MAG: translocation/assembly module TamB domain-containing protein, partial [Thermoanaerobaculia bacterium]